MSGRGGRRLLDVSVGFGAQVRARRRALGLTQAQLAERIGVDTSAVTRLERGQRAVPVGEVALIAEALSVGVAELFERPRVVAGDGVYRCVDTGGQVAVAPSVVRPVVVLDFSDGGEDGERGTVVLSRPSVEALVHQLVAWLGAGL